MVEKIDIEKRLKSFNEVVVGLSEASAVEEAKRCIKCKKPKCVEACPLKIDIPAFIKEVAEKDFISAVKVMEDNNPLPSTCGRVCQQEILCEAVCITKERPVSIGMLERFVGDYRLQIKNYKLQIKNLTDKKVAIVGSGPAGLGCAYKLARNGVDVKIYEALHMPGGVLRYGIPEFRLPKHILNYEIEILKSIGCRIICNVLIGRSYTLAELLNENDAVFIGSGAGLPVFPGIKGEDLCGIYSANEFLTRINLMHAYEFPEYHTPINVGKEVIVIGGGNTAIDAARCAKRLGANVKILYRRTADEMPARKIEIQNAKEEGVEFLFLVLPKEFVGDENGRVRSVISLKCEMTEQMDESGRRKFKVIEGSEFALNCDTVVIAISFKPNPLLPKLTPELKTDKNGYIIVNENMETSIPNVYAGGDIIGTESVIESIAGGMKAATAILKS